MNENQEKLLTLYSFKKKEVAYFSNRGLKQIVGGVFISVGVLATTIYQGLPYEISLVPMLGGFFGGAVNIFKSFRKYEEVNKLADTITAMDD